MFLGLDLQTWFGLTVLGAIVSTIGSLLGVVLKDYVFSRSFERWKQRQTLEQLYQKFRDPLLLSARELASRTLEVLNHFPTVYLNEKVLASRPEKQVENSIHDSYFQRYKLVSTAYRISSFMAWVELYRQELTFLDPGNNVHAAKLERAVGLIRSDLADGQLNHAEDCGKWKDTLVFREELRAIGESLIETRGSTRTVMGYGRYCEQLEATTPNAVQRWSPVVLNFFLDFEQTGKDFRQTRLKRLLVHLVELMRLIDHNPIEPYLDKAYVGLRDEVQ
ncbi:MAG: hypothetical protein AW11_01158 [Candidatus Accumulibacter regalis]|jgi:hypothetical protein|uniref:Uncharacterized protein n=1 Tax=Accumulibacter regalis TaxID=522306 RepID=A0A011PRF5_ACCRE|nr:hypothetical protein [Accumulibacter sp.]EXI89976.1 MAG: hypothetical protein AW11_01158 [Candidatus Accumulibacter regalis]HRE72621.1 hypothetical protein [Accumulibacter sp.]